MGEFVPRTIIVKFSDLTEALRYFRSDAGLTLEQVAEQMDCYYTAICHYELGNRKPSLQIIEQLANLYGYDVTLHFKERTKQ